MMQGKNIVYVSLLFQQERLLKFLGVFINEQKAAERCLSEPTRTRQSWKEETQNTWHNGAGLSVQVIPQELS